MSVPPTYHLHDLGPQAQAMANKRHQRARGHDPAIRRTRLDDIMAGAAAVHLLKELAGNTDRAAGRNDAPGACSPETAAENRCGAKRSPCHLLRQGAAGPSARDHERLMVS